MWKPVFNFGMGNGGSGGNGIPGPRGQDANQWLSGTGVPADSLGHQNDFYFQQESGQVWQKKSPFFLCPPRWAPIATLPARGPQGPPGPVGRAGPSGPAGSSGQNGTNGTNGKDGSTVTGYPLVLPPPGCNLASTSTASSAGVGYLIATVVPAPMLLDALGFQVTVGGSGSVQWGLFDYSSSASSATKLAGGTGALSSTGYQKITASSNPVSINPGAYLIVVNMPASNIPTVIRTAVSNNHVVPIGKFQVSYVWSDTPNLTSGWTSDSVFLNAILHGRLASGTTW